MKWKTKIMNDLNLPNDSEYVKILDQKNTLEKIFCEIWGMKKIFRFWRILKYFFLDELEC